MSVTIRDIARRANVSPATISRVLNNSGYVKQDTRELIEQIIKETGYRAGAFGRNIEKGSPQTIAVLVPNVIDSFYGEILKGVFNHTRDKNLNIMVFDANEDEEKELEILKGMCHQQCEGLIFSPSNLAERLSERHIRILEEIRIPVVVVGRDIKYSKIDNVFMEEEAGAFDAVNLLIRNGHKNIGILCGEQTIGYMRKRYHGYEEALISCDLKVQSKYVQFGKRSIDSAYQMTEHLLNTVPRPTAIFSTEPIYTLGLIQYMLHHDLTIGKDLAIVAFGDNDVLLTLKFNITSVVKATVEMGEYSAETLLRRLANAGSGDIIHSALIPEIQLRGSEKALDTTFM